ncbi:MAG: hypothetical protein QF662_05800, partial [Phycisphaerae bacterium]|nr:hypothetical protein [Phycisphaerae bacterium]
MGNSRGGSEVLENNISGLEAIALYDIPRATAALLPTPPILAYRMTGARWDAEVDVVDVTLLAMRETVIDRARYVLVRRADGEVMGKVVYEMRNRNQQFMKLRLPDGARPLLVRVSERPAALTPQADGSYLVALDRSVSTVGGLVSFPVEIVYTSRRGTLKNRGAILVSLPRVDILVAYGWCEAYLPEDLSAKDWHGPMRNVRRYASETAQAEFEYGRGHLAKRPEPAKAARQLPTFVPFGMALRPPAPGQVEGKRLPEDKNKLAQQRDRAVTLSRNYWRAGQDAYRKGKFSNAKSQLSLAISNAPKSSFAQNAQRLLGNIKIAMGEEESGDRASRAVGKQVKRQIQAANAAWLAEQQDFLQQAEGAAQEGDEEQAVAALDAAEALSAKLLRRGEEMPEQRAIMRKTRKSLVDVRKREDKRKKVEGLFDKAIVLKSTLKLNEARGTLDEILKMDPGNQRAKRWRKDLDFVEKEVERIGATAALGTTGKPKIMT